MDTKEYKDSELIKALMKIPRRGFSRDFQEKGLNIIVKNALKGVRPGCCKEKFSKNYNVIENVYTRLKRLGYIISDQICR